MTLKPPAFLSWAMVISFLLKPDPGIGEKEVVEESILRLNSPEIYNRYT